MSSFDDPRLKQTIKKEIQSYLYKPIWKYYDNWLNKIIARNCDANKTNNRHFRYRGQIYKTDNRILVPMKIDLLHESLRKEMDQYISELNYLDKHEIAYVNNFINQMLNATESFRDYYQILPESLHQSLANLTHIHCYQTRYLSDDSIAHLISSNEHSISLIKERLVKNLLL